MAKPELNDGFTRIANEILGALSRINLSAYETSVLLFIFRNTYGWQRKEDLLALDFIAEGTGIRKQHVWRALQSLREKRMIISKAIAGKHQRVHGFQKDYEQWIVTWRGNEPYRGVTSRGYEKPERLPVEVIPNNQKRLRGVTSRGDQQRKKERYKESSSKEKDSSPSLPEKVTEREKTMSLFVRLYTGAKPGYDPPFSEYPSDLVQDEIELLAEKWGDDVVQDAIREAAKGGRAVKPKRRYIERIIQRWMDEGRVKPIISKEEYEQLEEKRI